LVQGPGALALRAALRLGDVRDLAGQVLADGGRADHGAGVRDRTEFAGLERRHQPGVHGLGRLVLERQLAEHPERRHGRDADHAAQPGAPAPGLPGPGRGAAAPAGRLAPRPRLLRRPVFFLAVVILRPVLLLVPGPAAPDGLAHRRRPALHLAGASRVDALP